VFLSSEIAPTDEAHSLARQIPERVDAEVAPSREVVGRVEADALHSRTLLIVRQEPVPTTSSRCGKRAAYGDTSWQTAAPHGALRDQVAPPTTMINSDNYRDTCSRQKQRRGLQSRRRSEERRLLIDELRVAETFMRRVRPEQGKSNHVVERSRKSLPLLEFSDPLKERIIDLHPIANTIKEFYDRHIHTVRVTSSPLRHEVEDASRALKEIETNLHMLKARLTGALTRLVAALVEFEEESALLGAFAGATSVKGGTRGHHVHLWIAGVLQGEAERHFKRDLRLPWGEIEDCLRDHCGERVRDRGSLAKDVARNRKGPWFREAHSLRLKKGAEWPRRTTLR
jgi:hypothetical protein